MQLIGTFQAQYFKFLSADPNTIFQFVVVPDRIFILKIGSAVSVSYPPRCAVARFLWNKSLQPSIERADCSAAACI